VDIAIETDNPEAIAELTQIQGIGVVLATERRGADGATLATAVITLTPAIITALVAVIRAQIAARRYIKVTRKGMVIQGVSEETLMKILRDEQNTQH
jgi:chromate transport protein ChrA